MNTSDISSAFDVVNHRGHRFRIEPSGDRDLVGDLMMPTGTGAQGLTTVTIDGRDVLATSPLRTSGIRHGSVLGAGKQKEPNGSGFVAVWLTGPDAGGAYPLNEGNNIIGRSSTAAVRCADTAIELHHACIRVVSGVLALSQLAGGRDVLIDGKVLGADTAVSCDAVIEIGRSLLTIRRTTETGERRQLDPSPTDPWRITFVRTPRAIVGFQPTQIVAPSRATAWSVRGSGLLAPILGVFGAAIVAVVMHQWMFMIFGLLGVFVACGQWIAGRLGHRKTQRRDRVSEQMTLADFGAALTRESARYRTYHHSTTMQLDRALAWAASVAPQLWSVRATHSDAFRVTIGRGDVSWAPTVTGIDADTTSQVRTAVDVVSLLRAVMVPAFLGSDSVVGLCGDRGMATAVARSLIVQLAAASGPADWGCAIVLGDDRTMRGCDPNWEAFDWLPHMILNEARTSTWSDWSLVTALNCSASTERHLVLIVNDAQLLSARTSPLRRLLASDRSLAMIVICDDEVPSICTSSLQISRSGKSRWSENPHTATLPTPVHPVGISPERTETFARQLAPLVDPEQLDADAANLAETVSAIELLRPTLGQIAEQFPTRIATAWRSRARVNSLCVAIGHASDGIVEVDLVADGPHGLLAGTTGAGKSELLRTLVVSLATKFSPQQVNFVLVDYKGGSTFDVCSELPHVVGVVTDLDDGLATRALRSLDAELRRREMLLREAGASDLAELRRDAGAPGADERGAGARGAGVPGDGGDQVGIASLVVVIDEFATLAKRYPDFMTALLGIAQRGRSLGVHLILATQRPSGVVSDDIRANTNLRISLRVQDASDSNDVISTSCAAELPRNRPGRAIIRMGSDAPVTFQTARCTGPARLQSRRQLQVHRLSGAATVAHAQPCETGAETGAVRVADIGAGTAADTAADTELDVLVRSIRAAARLNGCATPHRPWVPELKSPLVTSGLARDVLGMIDEPDRQRVRLLRWEAHFGNLLIAGAPGSGTTTALLTIVDYLLHPSSTPTAIYVIDALGDSRWEQLTAACRCGAVVPVTDSERLSRLLSWVTGEIVRRKHGQHANGNECHPLVLVIDGLGSLRSMLMSEEQYESLQQLETVIADGAHVGVSVLASVSQPGSLSAGMLGNLASRWVFHLADAADGATLGVVASAVPAAVPGRFVIASSGHDAQIGDRICNARVGDGEVESPEDAGLRPTPIVRLSNDVAYNDMPHATTAGSDTIVPLGLAFDTLMPVSVQFSPGEHAMVLGPSRSGRSQALSTLAAGWHQAHPEGWIGCIAPRRSSLRVGHTYPNVAALLEGQPSGVPSLFIIDDAELVDDPTGSLATIINARVEGLTMIAAARPDSIRALYGHWSQSIRRSRLGVVFAGGAELDGDLLSAMLPRRLPIAPRAGLAWFVSNGAVQLMQVARVGEAAG